MMKSNTEQPPPARSSRIVETYPDGGFRAELSFDGIPAAHVQVSSISALLKYSKQK